jgi:ferredoxin
MEGGQILYQFDCGEDEALLEGIWRCHVKEMPKGCAGGGCGVCKIVISRGEGDIFKPMSRAHISDEERSKHVILACCTKPKSDMQIRFFKH